MSRLWFAVAACVCLLAAPAGAGADVVMGPMAGGPLTDTGQGGTVRPVDLDGDGRDDLAIGSATAATGGVRIRLANPAGGWISRPTLLAGQAIGDIVAADFDNDGKQDLLVQLPDPGQPLTGSDRFEVFPGKGDGTFAAALPLGLPGDRVVVAPVTGQAILTADLTGDGNLDLFMALTRGQFGAALGNGNGTFSQLSVSSDLASGSEGIDEGFGTIIQGDFDGNGAADFALGMTGSATSPDPDNSGVVILYGGSDPASPVPLHLAVPEPYGGVHRMLSEDVDGDGFDDLIVNLLATGGNGNPLTRHLLYRGGPDGFATAPATLNALPFSAPELFGDDFDGDGEFDLAWMERRNPGGAPNPNQLNFALGNGDSSFTTQEEAFDLDLDAAPDWIATGDFGDFNGDGSPDFAASFGSADCAATSCGVSVLLNRPTIALSDGSLAFGTVDKGSSPAGKTFTITNRGGAPTSLDTFVISGTAPVAFSLADQCGTLAPGQSCSPTVNFSTARAGEHSATLIYSFEGMTEEFRVELSGTVVDYHGSFDPAEVAFGDVQLGASVPARTVTLTADGDSGLTVGQLSLAGANPGAFRLAGDACSGRTVASGTSCSFEIEARPTAAGSASARVEVPSNGTGMASSVGLSVNGVAPVYRANLALKGPKKVRAGKKFKLRATVSNRGTAPLSGLVLRYTARQGKAVKARGQVGLPAIAVGRTAKRPISIKVPRRKLARGKPVRVTVAAIRQQKTLAARNHAVRINFPPARRKRG